MDNAQDKECKESVPTVHVPADLWDFGKRTIMADGQITIEAVAATFLDKGEDRHVVIVGNKEIDECQLDWKEDVPRMAAYMAVFDGHDGPRASEYCCRGLLHHILSETQHCFQKHSRKPRQKGDFIVAVDGSKLKSPLDAAIIDAFHRAHARFAKNLSPPSLEDVKSGVKATRFSNRGWLSRILPLRRPMNGGTTALTLMIYGENVEGSDGDESLRPVTHAVVANTGDCRLLTDDGSGTHEYRQVTKDHRPEDPDEHDRLVKCVKKGDAILGRETRTEALRVYPGGLAVCRTIGDIQCSSAAVCTPEIFRIPIATRTGKTRIILASDGLWDVMTNEQVGKIVARVQKKKETESSSTPAEQDETTDEEEVIVDANEAASNLMQECLKSGGYFDDVTLLVVDITTTTPTINAI